MTVENGSHREILIFQLNGRRFGVWADVALAVLQAVAIVPLPKAPEIVEGVVNVRGDVLPVLDFRKRFRLPPKSVEPSDHLILAKAGERRVLVRVDRVLDLARLGTAEIDDGRSLSPGSEYVAGIARLPDGLILIHDLATFLSAAEEEALTALTSEAAMP